MIPRPQLQPSGPGEYYAPQNTNWAWPWGLGGPANAASSYSAVPFWGAHGTRPAGGASNLVGPYMGVNSLCQAGVNTSLGSTSLAILPQSGMGAVPQVPGMAIPGYSWGGAPNAWQGGSLAGLPLTSLSPGDITTSLVIIYLGYEGQKYSR